VLIYSILSFLKKQKPFLINALDFRLCAQPLCGLPAKPSAPE